MKQTKYSPFVKQCFVTATVCFNIIGNTAAFGFPAVLLPQLQQADSSIILSNEQTSWLTSVMAILMVVGNFVATSLMDRHGRRVAHIAVAIPAIIGWLLTAVATSFEALLIGRMLQGLSAGISLPVRPVLVGEYTSPKNRGAFLTTISLAQSSGIFLCHLIGSLTSWQKTALICSFFPFVGLVMTLYSPESPSYLASKGRYDECRKVFRWLRGDDEEEELEELIEARIILSKEEQITTIREALNTMKKREFYKPIVLIAHAQSMLQYAGGTTMAAYSTIIIGLIVGKDVDVNFWMIALDTQRIISNCLAIYLINKYPRRLMMFSTGTLSVLSHIAIAVYVYARISGMLHDAQWIGILLINVQFFTVATGMVPLPNVIAGEVLPLQYRSIGSTIGVVIGGTNTFVALKTFPTLVHSIGIHGTYFLYAGILTYFLTVLWILLPETKGRTLQNIEDEYRGRPLKPEELAARKSLQMDNRKLSMISSTHSIMTYG